MAPTKINEFLDDDDEKFIARKCKKMLYFWPKKLKKNSRKDYRKKITLAYRILKIKPNEIIDLEGLEERLNEAFNALGSKKPKYLKDLFNKLMKFEKFKKTEPIGDYPDDSMDEEPPKSKKDLAWQELREALLTKVYKEFTNKYKDEDEDLELPDQDKEEEA